MSFTSTVKTELSELSVTKLEQLSELAGFLNNSIDNIED